MINWLKNIFSKNKKKDKMKTETMRSETNTVQLGDSDSYLDPGNPLSPFHQFDPTNIYFAEEIPEVKNESPDNATENTNT